MLKHKWYLLKKRGKTRSSVKFLTLTLVFSLFLSSVLPAVALAAGADSSAKANPAKAEVFRDKKPERLGEITSLRDQHSKSYLNSDGTVTVETTYESRHYKDSKGQWQDISNKLVEDNSASSSSLMSVGDAAADTVAGPSAETAASAATGKVFRNQANAFQAYFANHSGSTLAKIKISDNVQAAWRLLGANSVTAAKDDYTVTFPDILTAVDLQYSTYADGLKEDIVLKDKTAPASYQYELQVSGVLPVVSPEGDIIFQDGTGKAKFVLPKPYMTDNQAAVSQNVQMTIEPEQNSQDKGGKSPIRTYLVTVTPDAGWLGDPARAYPVKIDPSISTQPLPVEVGDNGNDTYISDYAPDTPNYNSAYLSIGYDTINGGNTASLVRFVLPNLPQGAVVSDSVFSIYRANHFSADSNPVDLAAARIIQDWPYNVTARTEPAVDDGEGDNTRVSKTTIKNDYQGWVDLNIYSIAKGWFNNPSAVPNYGLLIGNSLPQGTQYGGGLYYSSNAANGLGPRMLTTYIPDPTGVAPYWSYSNTDSGAVNTFNGNFLSSVTDFSLPGRGIAMNITRTYNSRGNLGGIFGDKWFSNLDIQLKSFSAVSGGRTYSGMTYVDGTGAEHPFILQADGKYSPPPNYHVKLFKAKDGGGADVYYLQEDTGPNQTAVSDNLPSLTFNSAGQLLSLKDGKGNTMQISRSDSSIVVTDPSGRMVGIILSGSKASQVINYADGGQEAVRYAYQGNQLVTATYDNGSYGDVSLSYTWQNGLLTAFTDRAGVKTYLTYNGNGQMVSSGIVNILNNPSFELARTPDDFLYWGKNTVNAQGTLQVDSIQSKLGHKSVKITSQASGGGSGDSLLYAYKEVPVNPGEIYTLSAYLKTEGLAGKAFLNVEQRDAAGQVLSSTRLDPGDQLTGTNDWTRKALNNLTIISGTATLAIFLEVQHDAAHAGGSVYFDGVQLEAGGQVTPFAGRNDFYYYMDTTQAPGVTTAFMSNPTGNQSQVQHDNYGNPALIASDPYANDEDAISRYVLKWDAEDNLINLTTPEQYESGKSYAYQYDPLGNMEKATDPLGRVTAMEYYFNHLKTLTQPGDDKVSNVWNPVSLNNDTQVNQAMNAVSYTYDDRGNLKEESNLLGIADNRVTNSGFERPSSAITQPAFSRASIAYLPDGGTVAVGLPRYLTGKFGSAVMIEGSAVNLLYTQGGGASTDWTKWSHWQNRTYWSAETINSDAAYGSVYTGTNANSSRTYLFDYSPYSITQNQPETFSMMLKTSAPYTGTITSYLLKGSDSSTVGVTSQSVSLNSTWKRVTFTLNPTQTVSAGAGLGMYLTNLPVGVQVSAARPQLEQLPYATTYTDTARYAEDITLPTAVFDPNQGTVETWVKFNAVHANAGGNALQTILNVAGTGDHGLVMGLDDGNHFSIQAGNGQGGTLKAQSTTVAQADTWYHVALKWSPQGLSVYVNGTKEGSAAGTPAITLPAAAKLGSTGSIRYLDGVIDDLRISKEARSDSDILAGYDSAAGLAVDTATSYKLAADQNLKAAVGSFQPEGWADFSPAGSVNRVEYDVTAPLGASNVLHVNPGAGGNAYQWTSDYIPLDAGKLSYTLSGYMRAADRSGGTAPAPRGASLGVYWYKADHSIINHQIYFNGEDPAWQRYVTTMQPPDGAAYARVMAITYGSYDGYYDAIQFEQSDQTRGYNFLENSAFEQGSLDWSASDGNVTIGADATEGNRNLAKITRTADGSSNVQSTLGIPVSQGKTYTFMAYVEVKSLTYTGSDSGVRLSVDITRPDGQVQTETMLLPLKSGTSGDDWACYALPLTPTENGVAKVRMELVGATGTVKFDNVRLSQGRLISSLTYDGNGNYVTSRTDQLNDTTTMENSAYGQVTKVTAPGGESVQYSYDGLQQLRSVTDNAGRTATYDLNANGQATAIYAPGKTTAQSSFTYDRMGNLLTETDSLGHSVAYSYDEGGRVTQKQNPNGTSADTYYDAKGFISMFSLTQGAKQIQYVNSYDREGRPTQSLVVTDSTVLTHEFDWGYDEVGNLTGYTEKDGQGKVQGTANAFTYSPKNELQKFTLNFGGASTNYSFLYSPTGLTQQAAITSAQYGNNTFNFKYDEGDNLIATDLPDNTKDTLTYNEAHQVVGSKTVKVDNSLQDNNCWSPIAASKYEYNSDGKLVQVTGEGAGSPTVTYTYNNGAEKLNRLTQAKITMDGTTQDYGYSYDDSGNILTMTSPQGTNTFTYDTDNRITSINGDATAVVYDEDGNLTQMTLNGQTSLYEYDALDRLIAVKDGSGQLKAEYTYDQDGQRLSKTVYSGGNSTTTDYHYLNGALMYESVNGEMTVNYLRSADGRLLGEQLEQNGVHIPYYYHYDAAGDVIAVTDQNGSLYRQYVYDPYGNVISVKDGSGNAVDINHDAGFNNAYTYKGYRYDQESGLYFLNSRYYQAGTGSFLTKDTVKGDPQDSRTLNRYAYTSGDPVNYFDPDGHGMVMNDDGTGPVVYTASSSGASKASSSSSSGSVAKAVSRPPVSTGKTSVPPKPETWVSKGLEYGGIAVGVVGLFVGGPAIEIIGTMIAIFTFMDMWNRGDRDWRDYVIALLGAVPLIGKSLKYGTEAGVWMSRAFDVGDGLGLAGWMNAMNSVVGGKLVKGTDLAINTGIGFIPTYQGRKK